MESLSNLNWFDIAVCIGVLILGLKGLISGLVREVFGLAGLIGGIGIASRTNIYVAELISKHLYKFDKPDTATSIGFLLVVVLVWLAAIACARFVQYMIRQSGLGFIDRIGGFIVGSAKIFLILAVILSIATKIGFIKDAISPAFKNSKAYPMLITTGNWILNLDTSKIKEAINLSPEPKQEQTPNEAQNAQHQNTKTQINEPSVYSAPQQNQSLPNTTTQSSQEKLKEEK